jgi:MFS family permease
MCVAQFMILLDVTIVNIALPSIQHELHVSPGNLEWVVSAYALSLAAFIPLGGALGDRFGRKRLFMFGMVVFALGSAACAVSTGDAALIGARAIQGVGGAVMSALTLSILAETYPPRERAGAIGLWAAIGGLGFGSGPVAGGVLLTFFSWSSVFWVNVPIAVAGLAVSAVAVTESGNRLSRRLDVPGVVTSAAGLVGVTVGLIESSSHPWGSWFGPCPGGRAGPECGGSEYRCGHQGPWCLLPEPSRPVICARLPAGSSHWSSLPPGRGGGHRDRASPAAWSTRV